MAKPGEEVAVDGRRARSQRSRQAVIDAALELMEEGNLIPTAQQISDRAGVNIRNFFRYFEDMESLFATIDEQTREANEALFLGGDREGDLEARVLHAVERHADGYEKRRNMILSTAAQLWRYEILRKNYAHYQRGLRRDLDDWLPELQRLAPDRREAVDAVTSFEMWHRLRYHQGLGKKAAVGVIVGTLHALLSQP